ncbi:MAG: tRNA (adenosine(37)-N6)-threonylcarbamoyltransferase complex ATPase subunit type 1 TsaE [Brevinema sp.]
MFSKIMSLQDLALFAQELSSFSVKIFVLQGDLGAGKTTFVRLFASSLGIEDQVSSPTFTLMNVYHAENCTIHHFDLYRLSSPEEALEWGFEDFVSSGDYNFIEWAERAWDLIPKPYVKIHLEHDSETTRKLSWKIIS